MGGYFEDFLLPDVRATSPPECNGVDSGKPSKIKAHQNGRSQLKCFLNRDKKDVEVDCLCS